MASVFLYAVDQKTFSILSTGLKLQRVKKKKKKAHSNLQGFLLVFKWSFQAPASEYSEHYTSFTVCNWTIWFETENNHLKYLELL